jgi:hypothetical protein
MVAPMSWWLLAIVIWFVVSFGVVALVVSAAQASTTARRSRNPLPVAPDHDQA